jgi:hypothetical protein
VTIYRDGAPLTPTYSSLSAAVVAAVDKDLLELSADTFEVHNLNINKKLILQGTYTATDSTVLDGKNMSNSRVLLVSNKLTIRDMIITGGNADGASMSVKITTGAGIYKTSNDTLTIEGRTIICNNMAQDEGGGIMAAFGMVYLNDNTMVVNNRAKNGGGISIRADGVFSNRVLIADNFAIGDGGGIYMLKNPLLFNQLQLTQDVQIARNKAMRGAGIFAGGTIRMNKNVQITDNEAIASGGGIGSYMTSGNYALYIGAGVQISRNSAALASAIYNTFDSLSITGANIWGNDVTGGPCINSERVLITSKPPGHIIINGCRIYNPMPLGGRNAELMVGGTLNHYFVHTDNTWWGTSDTTGVIAMGPGHALFFNSWVLANWKVNDDLPVTGLGTFPVTMQLTYNDLSPVPNHAFSLMMLQGKFGSSTGSFAANIVAMDTSNLVKGTYNAPLPVGPVTLTGDLDGDHFTQDLTVGTTSIPYVSGLGGINAYPNPATKVLFLDGTKTGQQATLYSVSGQVVFTQQLQDGKSELQLETLPAGNYLLRLSNETGWIGNTKLVKQ